MNTDNKINIKSSDVILECPNCLVCSILMSKEEHAQVEAGQVLVEVCQVCGKEVVFNG